MEVLYYTTASANSPVRKFVEGLPQSLQEDFLLALDRLGQGEALGMPLSKPLFNIALGLHELRFKERRSIYRVFYIYQTRGCHLPGPCCTEKDRNHPR